MRKLLLGVTALALLAAAAIVAAPM